MIRSMMLGGLGRNRKPAAGGSSNGLLTGLLAYWPMDETSGTRVDAHASYDLTDNNTVGSDAGVISNAALFNSASSEYLSLADDAAFSGLAAFTLSLWLYQTSSVASNRAIMTKWFHSSQTEFGIQTWGSGGEINMYIGDTISADGSIRANTTDASMSSDVWYHVAVVYNGAGADNSERFKVYVNGTAKTMSYNGTFPVTMANGSSQVEIGRFNNLDRYMHGRMDEMGFWNVALTSDQVTALYNAGAGLAYASFD